MNVKENLKKIDALISEISGYFNGMVSEQLIDMTDEYWTIFGEYSDSDSDSDERFTRAIDVGWSDDSPVEDPDPNRDDHVYSEEVKIVVRKDKFTLVRVRTSTGDGCEDFVFDNSKEIPEDVLNA